MDLDEKFDTIIQDAITEASGIDCSIEEYIQQLGFWQDAIRLQLQCSQGDLERAEAEREALEVEEGSDA